MAEPSIERYIETQKEKARNRVEEEVLNSYLKRNRIEKHKIKAGNRYKKTDEFAQELSEALDKDRRYKLFAAGLSSSVQKEYDNYVKQLNEKLRREEETRQQKAEREKAFRDWLEIQDVEGMIDEKFTEMATGLLDEIKKTLATGRLFVYGSYYQKNEISARTFKEFAEGFADTPYEMGFDKDDIPAEAGSKYDTFSELLLSDVLDKVIEEWDELREYMTEDLKDVFYDYVYEYDGPDYETYDIANDFWERFKDIFDEDYVCELIRGNPNYSHLDDDLKEIRRQEELAEQKKKQIGNDILKEIPREEKDLYPLARKIKRHFTLHIGPTNSGKTYDALKAFRDAETAVYLAPLRLLALEVFEETAETVPCNMRTGEEEILNDEATHFSQTIETVNLLREYDLAVIDEAQMISDPQRGGAWAATIMGLIAKEIHICAAPQAENVLISLIKYCGDSYDIVRHERLTPLETENNRFRFPGDVRPGDALVVFSKRSVLSCAAELTKEGHKVSVVYGALPYDVRKREVEKFSSGESDILVATDAIGMGLNLRIERICFLETEKFDGTKRRLLNASEIQQIAGRAGRKGIYPKGYVNADEGKEYIKRGLSENIPPQKTVRVNFPKELIHIDGKLSEIMEEWLKLPVLPPFKKCDISEQLDLCERIEPRTDDKDLIYNFVTVPFKHDDDELMSLWYRLFEEVRTTGTVNADRYYFGEIRNNQNTEEALQELEQMHGKYDMLYYVVDHYGDNRNSDKAWITEKKKRIADEIADILSKKKFSRKRCRMCGKTLPFRYRYGICQECYEGKQYYEDWDEYF